MTELRSTTFNDRPAQRVIFHVDMDAFYASVEQREDVQLRGRPVIVGASPEKRGVVCAASYEARSFGVRSAMPSVTAHKLCPNGVFIRPRMGLYRQESKAVMAILQQLGVPLEQVSVDEAYMDVSAKVAGSDHDQALVQSVSLGRQLKQEIRKERRLAASVGIASNKFLAKLASDYGKPDGLLMIPERDKVEFLKNLPVGRIHGVGHVTEASLHRAGLQTIGDLQAYEGPLQQIVGSWAETLKAFAFGIDPRPVSEDDTVKSMSSETTFSSDTEDRGLLRQTLREQAEELSSGLKKKKLRARTIQVKVRYTNFETVTRQLSVISPIDDAAQIYRSACHLLAQNRLVRRPLRLLGLGVSGLLDADWSQLEFKFKN